MRSRYSRDVRSCRQRMSGNYMHRTVKSSLSIWLKAATLVATGLFAAAVIVCSRSEAAEPNAPHVSAASDDGERAISRIKVPDGLKLQLWAAEPMLANPVAFCID